MRACRIGNHPVGKRGTRVCWQFLANHRFPAQDRNRLPSVNEAKGMLSRPSATLLTVLRSSLEKDRTALSAFGIKRFTGR